MRNLYSNIGLKLTYINFTKNIFVNRYVVLSILVFSVNQMIRMKIYITCLLILLGLPLCAQDIDLNIGETKAKNYFEEIDFEFVSDKIIVPVDIEGITYKFILDTGAPNIISKQINDLISTEVLKIIPIKDASGIQLNLEAVSVKALKFGNITFENTAALVYDAKSNPLFNCFDVDGIIGSNMLRHSIIQIDVERKKLIITDTRKKLNLDKNNSSKIKLIGNQSSPYVWVHLKGVNQGKDLVLFDTGANSFYDISKRNYEIFKNKDIFNVVGESIGASSVSLFGDVPVQNHYKVHLPTLEINGLEFNNCIAITTNDRNSRIGAEILRYGIVTIDFVNKRFYINSTSQKINIETPEFGFSKTLKNGKLIIGFIWDNVLAKQLSYGDEILEINGKDVQLCDLVLKRSDLDQEDTLKLKLKSKEGHIFEITVGKNLITKNTSFSTLSN